MRGQILVEPGRVPSHVHLPHAGTMISLVLPRRDAGESGTVTVSLKGAAGLGVDPTDAAMEAFVRGVVQMPGAATRVPTARLAEAARASAPLRRLLVRLRRGGLTVLRRDALGHATCECHDAVRHRYARLLPGARPAGAGRTRADRC